MKKINLQFIALLAGVIISSATFAVGNNIDSPGGTAAGATSSSTSGASAGAGATATGFNNGQGIVLGGGGSGSGLGNNNSHSVYQATDLSKGVGNAFAPALTTTLTETCMGSTSFGGGFSGGAFSFGTTWRDHACVRRLDAREIHSYGDIQASKEIMCDSDLVREAFKRVGRPCAEDGGSYVAVSQPVPASVSQAPAAVPMPMATDKPVRDDQDSMAKQTNAILDKADAERKIMKEKYGF